MSFTPIPPLPWLWRIAVDWPVRERPRHGNHRFARASGISAIRRGSRRDARTGARGRRLDAARHRERHRTRAVDAAIPFAEEHDWIYATVGIHPHEANARHRRNFAKLDELAKHPRVIGWGEMGLDYYYDHSPRDVQQQRLSAAARTGPRREAADHHPLPRRVARLSGNDRNRLAFERAWAEFFTALRERWKKRGADSTWVS